MGLTAEQLNLLYARRREQEQQKIERTEALNRYYDHWGKVTTRYEQLAGAEYYKAAESKTNKLKEQKEKALKLEQRRAALKVLLEKENLEWERQLEEHKKPKARRIADDPDLMAKINENVKQQENMRKKLELEAKLYGKWRHGVDDENLIFDSRSNNQVLAKLNWLDRQIAEQEQRERQEAETEQRNLEMQKEQNRMLEMQKQRQALRESELKEIRTLQEQHMEKMQELQNFTDKLSDEEKLYRTSLSELEKESELLGETAKLLLETQESSEGYNLRKIKLLLRKRSELVREAIKICISILERISKYTLQKERFCELRKLYKEQLDSEMHMLPMIDAMYESEAKYNLQKSEETWQIAHKQRTDEIKAFLADEKSILNTRLNENLQQQEDLVQLRAAHIKALEISNENLKKLLNEQEHDMPNTESNLMRAEHLKLNTETNTSQTLPAKPHNQVAKLSNSFTNLNLDVWQDMPVGKQERKSLSNKLSAHTLQVVTPENVQRPAFARKRVAWN